MDALKLFQNIELKFLGLRYINQINNPLINHNIEKYIDDSLYGNIITDNLNDDEEIIQVFTKLNIKKKDYLFTLQYGFFNPKFPNSNENKEFILDYDCVTNKIQSPDEVKGYLIEMNHLIYNQFNNSITEDFEEFMKKWCDNMSPNVSMYNPRDNVNTTAYNVLDSLSDFAIDESDKDDLNYFFQENFGFNNEIMNLLHFIHEKINSEFIGKFNIKLKLVDGDYFHDNLLGIFVSSSNFEDSIKLDNLSDSLYQYFEKDEVDKIILLMEF